MNPSTSPGLAINTTISKSQAAKRFEIDMGLADLRAEDWVNPEAAAGHLTCFLATRKQTPDGVSVYSRYVKAIHNVIISYTSNTTLRFYARKASRTIEQEEFRQKFWTDTMCRQLVQTSNQQVLCLKVR